ncbi:hypothetical protein [Methylorubrum aminovorans]|nr:MULTISPECIES: hypothetical protein [unclassified Methylobacterium]QIJ73345.1 hypothetical protein CLZ_01270 [Methylobacterium sp. CLZ]QIJ78249.1 hypothetical protein GU700_01270 [Methylobacterium sp. NI91]
MTATRPSDTRAAVAAWLAEGLDRATVVAPEALLPRVVTMHAQVSYRDGFMDQIGRVTLVYAGETSCTICCGAMNSVPNRAKRMPASPVVRSSAPP